MPFYIRVLDVDLFNTLYTFAKSNAWLESVRMERKDGYYLLTTANPALWHELFLYGQLLAQEQDAVIDGGEVMT